MVQGLLTPTLRAGAGVMVAFLPLAFGAEAGVTVGFLPPILWAGTRVEIFLVIAG